MTTFQIHALPLAPFAHLFGMGDAALRAERARRVIADAAPGFPCRVSLSDAAPGETVILVHHEHLAVESPYRASHALYVREGAQEARPAPGAMPDMLARRVLSFRAFDGGGMMRAADIAEGAQAGPVLTRLLELEGVVHVDIHFAAAGCFAARATVAA